MTLPAEEAPITFKSLGRHTRKEVFRLASMGKRHPDPKVADAAYRWSHAERWNSVPNMLPGWLLPSIGIALLVLSLIARLPAVFIVGGAIVAVFGFLGWISTYSARALRAVYLEEPVPEA